MKKLNNLARILLINDDLGGLHPVYEINRELGGYLMMPDHTVDHVTGRDSALIPPLEQVGQEKEDELFFLLLEASILPKKHALSVGGFTIQGVYELCKLLEDPKAIIMNPMMGMFIKKEVDPSGKFFSWDLEIIDGVTSVGSFEGARIFWSDKIPQKEIYALEDAEYIGIIYDSRGKIGMALTQPDRVAKISIVEG